MKKFGAAVLMLQLNGVRATVRRIWCVVWSLDVVLDLFTGNEWRLFWATVKVLRDHLESQIWEILHNPSHALVGLPLFMFDLTLKDATFMWGNLHSRRSQAIWRNSCYHGRRVSKCKDRSYIPKLVWDYSVFFDKDTP
jgi:hypothetical protein